jgi:His/Glu/Gln/Arg/opine family amino acid ABC transporter permease subunit
MDLHGFGWQLAVGTWMTVRVAAASLVPGLLLGLLGAGAALSRFRLLRAAADTYSTVIRGVPELLVLLLLYFGGTVLLSRVWSYLEPDAYVEVDAFTAGVVALSVVFGAYATEVFRGAILAMPRGQIEAARAIGMRPWLILRRILLPQVWRFALPGLGNLWLVLLKDTSLVSVVGLDELMRKAYVAAGSTREPFTYYSAAACIYLLLTIVSMAAIARLETLASRGVRRA